MCIYGIELLPDNIADCRKNLLEIFAAYLNLDASEDLYRATVGVLSQNSIHAQRRDFRLDALTQSSAFSEAGSLFAHLDKHEIFTPARTYPPMTVRELAAAATEEATL